MRIRIDLNFARALSACAILATAFAAHADRRTLVRAYEVQTQPEGNLEVEIWNDAEIPKSGVGDSLLTQRVEIEYGITDRWDLALYHVFQQGGQAGGDNLGFHLDSWRLETRYRLAERGDWPIDVMVYLEFERPADFTEPWEIEEKVILEKDFGKLALVANLVAEQRMARGDQAGHLWEVDLGARYEILPALRIGAEIWGTQETVSGQTTNTYYAGPSFSIASKKIWLQLGVGIGLNDASNQAFVRSVIGFNL
jgi:hypothetical protein